MRGPLTVASVAYTCNEVMSVRLHVALAAVTVVSQHLSFGIAGGPEPGGAAGSLGTTTKGVVK